MSLNSLLLSVWFSGFCVFTGCVAATAMNSRTFCCPPKEPLFQEAITPKQSFSCIPGDDQSLCSIWGSSIYDRLGDHALSLPSVCGSTPGFIAFAWGWYFLPLVGIKHYSVSRCVLGACLLGDACGVCILGFCGVLQ